MITYLSGTSALSISGTAALTITGGAYKKSANLQRILAPVVLGASQTWNARNGLFRTTNTVALGSGANNYTLTIDGASDVELNNVVSNGGSGASGLIKNGTGSLDLNASNTFTGGV